MNIVNYKKIIQITISTVVVLLIFVGCTHKGMSEYKEENYTIDNTISRIMGQSIETINDIRKYGKLGLLDSINEGDISSEYALIIGEIYKDLCLCRNTGEYSGDYFSVGIKEICIGIKDIKERLNSIAYCVVDINNDGVKELVICDPSWPLPGNVRILDMYTMVDDKVVKVITGWSRNRYYLLDDGYIYNEGSGGAAYSSCETFYFNANDGTLITQKLYFTYLKGEEMTEGGYGYNEVGVQDPSISVEISREAYMSFMETCEAKIVQFNVKTFDSLK